MCSIIPLNTSVIDTLHSSELECHILTTMKQKQWKALDARQNVIDNMQIYENDPEFKDVIDKFED